MERINLSIRQLSEAGVGLHWRETIDTGAQNTLFGVMEQDQCLQHVRARSDVLRQNPGSERALRDALGGVRQTYEAVIDAIDVFLSPLIEKLQIELRLYKPIASGRMVEETERRRGHCKRITQIYIESGGLRDSLPPTVTTEAKDALDT